MAKRHPRATQSKRNQGEPDDVFIARILEIGQWARANQQVMTVLAVLAVIGVAGLLYYVNYRSSLNAQAAQQLEGVYQSLAVSDPQGAQDQLVVFLERFDGTAYEGEARLLLGELYLENGQPQQAQAVLEPISRRPSKPIEMQAAMLLGKAYEQDGRWAEAERVYLEVADRSDLEFQIIDALAAAARIRAENDDPQGAVALYERVLSRLQENDPARGLFQMRIAELRAQANA